MTKKHYIGFFHLLMINIIAVASIRALPFGAQYGFSLVFYYLLGGLVFFLPTALIVSELSTGWPTTGGIYVWVREAFGKRMSLVVIWLSWAYNLFWYPTILALIAGAFAYLFHPDLVDNKAFMASAVLLMFWGLTFINFLGLKKASFLSTLGATFGTILPMALVTLLGLSWYFQGKPTEISFDYAHFLPNFSEGNNLGFLSTIIFGLLGLEMAAAHASEVHNPKKTYPRVIAIASVIILASLILSSLAIAIVVPHENLSLVVGSVQAFALFAQSYNMPWLLPLMVFCIILGGLSAVAAWMIGPTKGIMVASRDGSLPAWLGHTNEKGVPTSALLVQGVVVSVLSLLFIFMPSVKSTFWTLSLVTSQLALIVYIALFATAIKLHHHHAHIARPFKIPGGNVGMWITGGVGIASCITVIGLGFIPIPNAEISNPIVYGLGLFCAMVILCVIPLLFRKRRREKKEKG